MKVTWKPPVEQNIQTLLCNLSKEDILPKFRKQYSKSMSCSDVWKQYDQQTKKHYQKTLKKPFYYFQEEEFKKQRQVSKLAHRLKNRSQCVDYFSWEGTKLFFKNQEMNPCPEQNYRENPFYVFSRFDRKAFISDSFDNCFPPYAQMNMDKLGLVKHRQSLQDPKVRQQSPKNSKIPKKKQLQFIVKKNSQKRSPLQRTNTINYLKSPLMKIQRKSSQKNSIGNKINELHKSWSIYEGQREKLQINQLKLLERLKKISESSIATKSSIRVYKQQIRTVIVDRYGFDNLTSFMNLQSILGYQEMVELLNKMLSMNEETIIFFCFNIMDSNQDGQISDSDIFNLLKYSRDNPLLEEDYLKIANYHLENRHRQIVYAPSTDLFINQPTFTSFITKKNFKTKPQKPQENPPKFFNLVQSFEQNQRGKIKKKLSRQLQKDKQQVSHSLKYETYKDIFKDSIPLLYYDILFVLGAIQKPNLIYQPVKQPYTELPKTESEVFPSATIKKSRYFKLRTNMRKAANTLPKVHIS